MVFRHYILFRSCKLLILFVFVAKFYLSVCLYSFYPVGFVFRTPVVIGTEFTYIAVSNMSSVLFCRSGTPGIVYYMLF